MIKFHSCFKNGAILQRGAAFIAKGYSDGETIVSLCGGNHKETVTTTAKNGMFYA